MIRFRKAKKEDIKFLTFLRECSMKEHIEEAGIKYIGSEQVERVLYEFEYAQVIEYKTEDIGLFKINNNSSPWYIIQIQILPEFQGRGIGDYILKTIIKDAKKLSKNIKLSVYKNNPALKLYKRNGFKIVEENEDSFIMNTSFNTK